MNSFNVTFVVYLCVLKIRTLDADNLGGMRLPDVIYENHKT